jgi:hypothetical protein
MQRIATGASAATAYRDAVNPGGWIGSTSAAVPPCFTKFRRVVSRFGSATPKQFERASIRHADALSAVPNSHAPVSGRVS